MSKTDTTMTIEECLEMVRRQVCTGTDGFAIEAPQATERTSA